MKCERAQQALTPLLDGELDRLTGWRVRGHLRRCAACAALATDMKRLAEQARRWRHVNAPVSLRARLHAALAQTSPTQAAAAPARRHGGSTLRNLTENPLMRRSLAAGLAGAALLSLFLTLPRRGNAAYAYLERAAAAHRHIRSVHFQGWRTEPDGRRTEIELWFARPYRSWSRYGKEISINDGKREWSYVAGEPTATYQPVSGLKAEDWLRMLDVEQHLRRARGGYALYDLGLERIGGSTLRKIRLGGEGYTERETWWLDPATHLVKQKLWEKKDDPLSEEWRVMGGSTRIEYNVTPPKGLFVFASPPGVRIIPLSEKEAVRLDSFMGDGRALMRQQSKDTTVELLSFWRSANGDAVATFRPTPYIPLRPILTDSDGGRYVGFNLRAGSQQEKEYVTVFFREKAAPPRPGVSYRLRLPMYDGMGERWVDEHDAEPLAVFELKDARSLPAGLDRIANEYARRHQGATLPFYRAAALGSIALRQGRTAEGISHLDTAAALAGPDLARQMNPHELHDVLFQLADLHARSGRTPQARAVLDKLHRAATYDQKIVSVAVRAAEAMERLGERELAGRWMQQIIASREFAAPPRYIIRIGKAYERLTGDQAGATQYLVSRLEQWLRAKPVMGTGDGWEIAKAFEAAGRNDLALETYVKALETSDMLKQYRESGGKIWREDTERYIAQIRRLGGEQAVRGLTVRPLPPGY